MGSFPPSGRVKGRLAIQCRNPSNEITSVRSKMRVTMSQRSPGIDYIRQRLSSHAAPGKRNNALRPTKLRKQNVSAAHRSHPWPWSECSSVRGALYFVEPLDNLRKPACTPVIDGCP